MTTSTAIVRMIRDVTTTSPADAVRRALEVLHPPGSVFEVRVLGIPGRGKPHSAAGYFDDHQEAAAAITQIEKRRPAGLYTTLNQINPGLVARSPNTITDYLEPTTSDGDILRRRWLLLDFDPKRPAAISSDDGEHCAAYQAAVYCREWVRSLDWPDPVLADSGNGWHLLYRINLDVSEESARLVQSVLDAVAVKVAESMGDGPVVEVDRKVFNAARISKVYGTMTRKGHAVPDRPHRRAELVEVPEPVEVVSVEALQAVASLAPQPPKQSARNTTYDSNGHHRLDVSRWLTAQGVAFRLKDRQDRFGRTVYLLEHCPFDASHGGNGEVSIMQGPDGKLAAACMHNSCAGKGWREFKGAIGAPTADMYDPPLRAGDFERAKMLDRAAEQSEENPNQPPPFTRLLSGEQLLALDLRPRFLVKSVLVDGQPCIIGGRSKVLKTSIAVDLAVSLGSGTPFLGRFDAMQVGVGFWSGESGAATIRETARRIVDSKGIGTLADADVSWCFDLPRLSQLDHLDHLAEVIRGQGLRVAILDPLYLALLSPETASGASNLFLMGSMLQGLTRLGQDTGCTLILLHHFRKGGPSDDENPAGLEELSQSGVSEWARQWLLLQRRVPYQGDGQHLLWLRCGGSAGHSSLWGLTIDEGTIDPDTFGGRTWEVTVAPAADAREQTRRDRENRKAAEKEAREAEHRERLLRVLRQNPEGDTAKALREAAGLNPANFAKAVSVLLQEGRAARCKVVKNKREEDGFRPTKK